MVSRLLVLDTTQPVVMNNNNIGDSSWSALKNLHPRLPDHVSIQPRTLQGETWYILQDALANQFHRLNETAYTIIGLMDGKRSLDDILQILSADNERKDPAGQSEIVKVLQYLQASDLLVTEALPKINHITERHDKKRLKKYEQFFKNPVIWRIPLFNPNALLEKCMPFARFLVSPYAGFIWLVAVSLALMQAVTHWHELTATRLHEVFSPQNLFLIWLIYPLLKFFHELGHALFTKVWNGSVYECGLVFILGTPLPYVDATSATGIYSKHKRVMIGSAGMAVELFLASISLFIWLQIDNGLLKNILFNIILIGGVSTLLFNCNPLMRFDGYYILSDLLDIPNLARRAQNQLVYVLKKQVLRVDLQRPEPLTHKMATGLTLYAIAAFVYRAVVLFTIIVIATTLLPMLGLLLSIWLIISQLLIPLFALVRYLFYSPELGSHRYRRIATVTLPVAIFLAVLLFVPIPHHSHTQGIVWLPDDALVRADADGFVVQELVNDGDYVTQGQPLMQMSNPKLEAELAIKQIELQRAEVRYQSAWLANRTQVEYFSEDIKLIKSEIAALEKRTDALAIRSAGTGTYKKLQNYILKGSYVRRGDSIALIHAPGNLRIRTALKQEDIAKIRHNTRSIELQTASLDGRVWQGKVHQEVPRGTFKLPSAALGTAGGGPIAVSHDASDGTTTLEEVFLVDILPLSALPVENFGERVWVRFSHPAEPAVLQLYHNGKAFFQRLRQSDRRTNTHP